MKHSASQASHAPWSQTVENDHSFTLCDHRSQLALGVFLLIALTLLGGCRRPVPRPEGLPPLVPCTVTVTFGGEAIENVGVLLRSTTPDDNRWGAGGRTDAEGKVVLKTAGSFDGVVPGEYVISFSKRVTRSDGPMGEEVSLIPEKYERRKSSEIITVTEGQAEYSLALDGLSIDQRP